jgi:hypothetical protein
MAVEHERIPGRTIERVRTTRRSLVLDTLGGPNGEVRHLAEMDRQPAFELSHELRVLCNSLIRVGSGRYELQPHRASWRYLRDIDEASLALEVRRCERIHAGWQLPGNGSIHERVDAFLS